MIPLLEGLPTKAKEAPSPHEGLGPVLTHWTPTQYFIVSMNFPIIEDCLRPFNEHMNLTIHIWSQGKKFVIKGEKERTKK